MKNRFLETKFHIPPERTGSVRRSRLIERLRQGLNEQHKLTLISAPAGYGKTTLIVEWLQAMGEHIKVAWLSLDENDNDVLRFMGYCIAALQHVDRAFGKCTQRLLEMPQIPPLTFILEELINDLAGLPGLSVLVLDDYHVITNPALHEALEYFIGHQPPQLHLAITTRADPPFALARLRGLGHLTELRVAELRFTRDETSAFLNSTMGLQLQQSEVDTLLGRTEGWAAGLQLAALSLQGQEDPHQYIQSFSGGHHYVLDYLVEEVLNQQPEHIQRFLENTAILERFCGSLCDALTGKDDGAVLLTVLNRANMFLSPLDNERVWYRYHHLFRNLLLARLVESNPGAVSTLHRRAAQWFAEHGFPTEAVQHAFAAQDYLGAAELLEQHAPSRWALSDTTFMTMIGKLPVELVQSRPGLAIHHAFALVLMGQHTTAEMLLRGMLANFPGALNPEMKAIESFATVLLAYIAELSGRASQVELPDPQALQFVPEYRLAMRNTADAIYAFLLHFRGEFERAVELLLGVVQRDLAANGTTAIPLAIARIGSMRIVQGRLHEAAGLCREYIRRIQEQGQNQFYISGSLHFTLGDILREWNEVEQAEQEIRRGLALNEPWPNPETQAIGAMLLGRVLLAQDKWGEVLKILEKIDQTVQNRLISPDIAADIRSLRVRLWLAQGNLSAASDLVRQVASQTSFDFRHERDQITLARVRLAQDSPDAAHTLLERLKITAEQGERTGRQIEIGLLNALALQALQQPVPAFQELELCLLRAEPQGYMRIFLDEGERLGALLAEYQVRAKEPNAQLRSYIIKLLAAFPPSANVKPDQSSLIEPLTAREIEVLRWMCEGDSNQAIAEKLVVTVAAVKKHAGNIFGKLGVSSRTQAIVCARKLNLLSPKD